MKYFFIAVFLSFSLCAFSAQQRIIDSLKRGLKTQKDDSNKVNTLNFLCGRLWRVGKFDTALMYAAEAQTLAQKLDYKKGIAASYRNMGIIFSNKGNYGKSFTNDLIALSIDMETGDKQNIASDYTNIGLVYDDKGEYAKALDYDFKALKISEETGNKPRIGLNAGNIGNVYGEEGDYPKALEYYFKALKINEELKLKELITHNLNNIAIIYENQGDFDKALDNYYKALDIKQKLGDKAGVASTLGGIGNLYCEKGDYAKAIENNMKALKLNEEIGAKSGIFFNLGSLGAAYDKQGDSAVAAGNAAYAYKEKYPAALDYDLKALGLCREIGNKEGIANNLVNAANVYTKQKKYADANKCLAEALETAVSIHNKGDIKNAYNALSALDKAMGNDKEALQHYKMFIVYRDSLVNEANTKKTVQAEMNFDFEQKQAAEKAEQDKKDAVAEQERNKQKVIRNSFVAGFALTLALAFFIFRGYRQKQKDNIIITEQKEEVEKQKALVENQKLLVEERNKDILDSITYAKRLQDAILPPLSLIKQHLPESFVLYKPKDIVAGDFYWMEYIPSQALPSRGEGIPVRDSFSPPVGRIQEGMVLIAAADCTGHGVPGALVSVVCSNALNRTVKEFKITEPGKILDKVRELVLETFEKSEGNIQDGMDISLASLTPSKGGIQLSWSGAYNSLWYIQGGEMKEIVADKQPIGKTDNPKPFTTHSIAIPGGQRGALYLFTDGFADQFGGPKGKKYKYQQLQQLIMDNTQLTMEEQKKLLEKKFEEWKGDLEQVDDVLVIGIRI